MSFGIQSEINEIPEWKVHIQYTNKVGEYIGLYKYEDALQCLLVLCGRSDVISAEIIHV